MLSTGGQRKTTAAVSEMSRRNRLVTVAQVAEAWSVDPAILASHLDDGGIPPIGETLYRAGDLIDLVLDRLKDC